MDALTAMLGGGGGGAPGLTSNTHSSAQTGAINLGGISFGVSDDKQALWIVAAFVAGYLIGKKF